MAHSRRPSSGGGARLIASRGSSVRRISTPRGSGVRRGASSTDLTRLPLICRGTRLRGVLAPVTKRFRLRMACRGRSTHRVHLFLRLRGGVDLSSVVRLVGRFRGIGVHRRNRALVIRWSRGVGVCRTTNESSRPFSSSRLYPARRPRLPRRFCIEDTRRPYRRRRKLSCRLCM